MYILFSSLKCVFFFSFFSFLATHRPGPWQQQNQVYPVRRWSWHYLCDQRQDWRHPRHEEAGQGGEGWVHPDSPGRGQGHQPAPGAPLRIHHQGPGHQWQRSWVCGGPLPRHGARDVCSGYVCVSSPCSQPGLCQEAVELVMNNKVFIMLLAFICIFSNLFLARAFICSTIAESLSSKEMINSCINVSLSNNTLMG